jgi:hypothetical protein
MRVLLTADPFSDPPELPWIGRGRWPARWLALPNGAAYRLRLALPTAVAARLHVSADERYELFLDGERLGRGPERGDLGASRVEVYPHEPLLAPAAHPPMLDRPWAGATLRHLDAPPAGETHDLPVLAARHLADGAPARAALLRGEAALVVPARARRRAIVTWATTCAPTRGWLSRGAPGRACACTGRKACSPARAPGTRATATRSRASSSPRSGATGTATTATAP